MENDIQDVFAWALQWCDRHPLELVDYFGLPLTTEQTTILFNRNVDVQKQIDAKTSIASIPNWATWTQAQWTEWFNANLANGNVTSIGNLPDAKLMLQKQNSVLDKLAKVVIALRDKTFPRL